MNRTREQWEKVEPYLVVEGSQTQARNVLEMALQDIRELYRMLDAERAAARRPRAPHQRERLV